MIQVGDSKSHVVLVMVKALKHSSSVRSWSRLGARIGALNQHLGFDLRIFEDMLQVEHL